MEKSVRLIWVYIKISAFNNFRVAKRHNKQVPVDMDISENPMCDDHPNTPAEVLCIKHRQFVCMTCAVEGKKHVTKKCDSKPIRNLTSQTDLKLVSLLAMKSGIMGKKRLLEKHISDTDQKKMDVKEMVEKFQKDINEAFRKKLEMTLKSVDDKSNVIQENNKKRMEKIDKVNSMFEAEIDRLTNKKDKTPKQEAVSLSDLKENACNLPFKDLRIAHGFDPDRMIKNIILQSTSLGNVLFSEDDEVYDQLDDVENAYLIPSSIKTQSKQKDTQIIPATYEDLITKDDAGGVVYRNLELKGAAGSRGYKTLSVIENTKGKTKSMGYKSQPLPEIPFGQEGSNTASSKGSSIKLDTAIKSIEKRASSPDYKNRVQSPTSPLPKSMVKTIGGGKIASGPLPTPIVKTTAVKQQPTPKRSSSLLEKYFGENPEVMSANEPQKSLATPAIKNKSVTIANRKDVKRRITKLTIISSNRIFLLDELNSAILLVKTDGGVISEQTGERFVNMVGAGRDIVAVLGNYNYRIYNMNIRTPQLLSY